MKRLLQRLNAEHGMLLVLALLCSLFSVLTLSEQPLDGEAAVAQVDAALGASPAGPVLIAVRDLADERAYADALERRLRQRGVSLAASVRGDPGDVRRALQELAATQTPLHAILTSAGSARWLVFADAAREFPGLGQPRLLWPASQRWPNFLKADNLLNIANQIAVIAILAIGMTLVILTGGIDLSVGSLLALAAVTAAWFIREQAGALDASAAGMTAGGALAVLLCALAGAFNGLMITRFGIPPFIATLAMMLVASGLAYTLAEGQSIYQLPERFVWLGRDTGPLGLPNAVLLMAGLYLLAHLLLSQTRLGRHLYAVGGNREAAHLSGVPVNRVLGFAYLTSGLLAGLGGVVMASQLKSGSPTYGGMYELYVIAAVVVGGTSLNGGKGGMLGTLTGAFIIAVIQNGMNLTNVESYTQKVVLGAVILAAVLADRLRR